MRLAVFVLSAPITGLAGWLYAYQRAYVGPDMFETYFLVMMLTAVVLVGRRVLLGPLIGTALLIAQQNLFSLGGDWNKIVLGVALAVVLILFPSGLVGLYRRIGNCAEYPTKTIKGRTIMNKTIKLATALFPALAAPAMAQDIKVGTIFPLSGGAGPDGQAVTNAVKLVGEQINDKGGLLGRKLTLVSKDDESTPAVGVSRANEMIAEKADVVVEGWNSPVTLAMQPILAGRHHGHHRDLEIGPDPQRRDQSPMRCASTV